MEGNKEGNSGGKQWRETLEGNSGGRQGRKTGKVNSEGNRGGKHSEGKQGENHSLNAKHTQTVLLLVCNRLARVRLVYI